MNVPPLPPAGPVPNPSPPPSPFPSRRKGKGLAGRVAFAGVALSAVGGGGYFALPYIRSTAKDDTLTATVTRGDLVISVTERGELESSQSVSVKCELEREQAKLVSIVPEGTRVKKGEVVGRFDTDAILRSISEQEVKSRQADGKAKAAKKDLEITENKGQGDIDKAELAYKLAKIDWDSYREAEYQVELDKQKSAIELAKKSLQEAEDTFEFTKTMVKKGFEQQENIRKAEFGVQEKKFFLAQNVAQLMLLERFTKLKKETELSAKAKDAERDLARTKKSTEATNEKSKSDLEAAQETAKVEKETLERSRKQLTQCEIKAPENGIVIYFKRYWDESSRIQPGATMYFGQPIFSLPDLTKMKVNVKVHESVVKKVQKGQTAGILIDALSNQPLTGTVEVVATVAASEGWRGGAVKEYQTEVSVKDLPTDAGLKPGMTAEVKIAVKTVPNALLVPVQAVTEKGGQYFAYVKGGGRYERKEVKVGETNDTQVQIVEGLDEGAEVALDARARSNAEVKASGGDKDKKDGEKKDKEPAPASVGTPVAGK